MKSNTKALVVQKNYLAKLPAKKPATKKQIIIALVGLVGSGKSFVAKKLSRVINANIICGDDIRYQLRRRKITDNNLVIKVGFNIFYQLLKRGDNIIMDADFATGDKTLKLKKIAREQKTPLYFIHTYADIDTMIGRIITQNRNQHNIFSSAKSAWLGSNRAAIVKIREIHRRTPHHYRWQNIRGGQWTPKKLPLKFLAEINTGDQKKSKVEIKKLIQKVLTL